MPRTRAHRVNEECPKQEHIEWRMPRTKHKAKSVESKSSHNKERLKQGHTERGVPKAKTQKTKNAQSKNIERGASKAKAHRVRST